MTMQPHRLLTVCALLACTAWLALPGSARAAQSYDSCTGFIDSLPATITTQGTWCLRGHLSTNVSNGNAITIAANNVTLDCNEFRIGGLGAGDASYAIGIRAQNRVNATVRNCTIRGFNRGIYVNGGAGHLIEDNRLDNNLNYGILLASDNSLVQRNHVYDTGGRTGFNSAYGISATADIIGNTVSGLYVDWAGGPLQGIRASGADGVQIRDNIVSGFNMGAAQGGSAAGAYGINVQDSRRVRVSGNHVASSNSGNLDGVGIRTTNNSTYCLDNTVGGFDVNIHEDCISSRNVTL